MEWSGHKSCFSACDYCQQMLQQTSAIQVEYTADTTMAASNEITGSLCTSEGTVFTLGKGRTFFFENFARCGPYTNQADDSSPKVCTVYATVAECKRVTNDMPGMFLLRFHVAIAVLVLGGACLGVDVLPETVIFSAVHAVRNSGYLEAFRDYFY